MPQGGRYGLGLSFARVEELPQAGCRVVSCRGRCHVMVAG